MTPHDPKGDNGPNHDVDRRSARPTPRVRAFLRAALRLAVLVLVIFALHRGGLWVAGRLSQTHYSWAMPGLTLLALLVYALLVAIPFVPGIEIGITLLVLSGPAVAPAVWTATVMGLSLAFVAGCRLPYRWLQRLFLDLHLRRASILLERVEGLPPEDRVALLQNRLPHRFAAMLLRFRYVALALLINMPGNAVLGGGGGIAMVCGISGLFRVPAALLTIALAAAPVPLAVWGLGWTPAF